MDKQYGLIFDLDGVIADTESVNVSATAKAFEKLFGLTDVKPEDFEAGLGRGAEEYVKAGARAHGVELTDEQAKEAAKLRQENFLKILAAEPLAPYPGVVELIEEGLALENVKVAIATSGTLEKSRAALEAAKIPYRQMVYVNGGDVKNKKPDPELFLTAAGRMGLAPERAAALSLWLYSAVWLWYLQQKSKRRYFFVQPWYPGKTVPSFADALSCLRRVLWRDRIKFMFEKITVHNKKSTELDKNFEFLIEALASAA